MSEERKYWVPALEKADKVLAVLAKEPAKLKLIDLSRQLDINKSSMFSLLNTMETLGWVKRSGSGGDTYSLGHAFAEFGSSYLKQYDLHQSFQEEAAGTRDRLQETVQLAKRAGDQVLYLGKLEAVSPVRLQSEPGMRLPAHATALGKAMLAQLSEEELLRLYPQEQLEQLTPHTIGSRTELFKQLETIRAHGFALDDQESVMGFRCVAAPIRAGSGEQAAVSCSMLLHQWAVKSEQARAEMQDLARRLSV
ncbi:IclR family transcriptional regulator [Paenibacillus taihuensis]|uniref:IclR family transcriptional regulator n=1 Tax=Paenibacillus taihuensis TaxID=1156355 RepID=A0A3D9RR62_9BACL|nr:IclR family transcriptional regulator [Paenibacillus taihuensis]REE78905.1 IclR family transcriptional regulator [Paenibacillus taihuensis]